MASSRNENVTAVRMNFVLTVVGMKNVYLGPVVGLVSSRGKEGKISSTREKNVKHSMTVEGVKIWICRHIHVNLGDVSGLVS